MINIKNKTVLTSLVIVSLLFIVPYVQSFSIGDLGDMVGYVLFNSFDVISGKAVYHEVALDCSTVDPNDECIASGGSGGGGICGNGLKEDGEGCDVGEDGVGGTDDDVYLSFQTCENYNFDGGELSCTDTCDLIQDGCYNFNDGECEEGETCENSPADCGECTVDCSVLTCQDNWDVCDGEKTIDCDTNEICSNVMGQGFCAEQALSVICGDGIISGSEVCDGIDLGVESCATQGYNAGSLACSEDCLSFDVSGCVSNFVVIPPADDEPPAEEDPDDRTSVKSVSTCAAINGICTNECGTNYEHYTGTNNLDEQCADDYGEDLICCVPSYILDAGFVSESGDYGDIDVSDEDEFTGTVKSVEDYMIQREQEAAMSAPSYALEGGLQQVLTSPSYAMGGVWIVFVLTTVIVGMTYYLHANVGSKIKLRRKKRK